MTDGLSIRSPYSRALARRGPAGGAAALAARARLRPVDGARAAVPAIACWCGTARPCGPATSSSPGSPRCPIGWLSSGPRTRSAGAGGWPATTPRPAATAPSTAPRWCWPGPSWSCRAAGSDRVRAGRRAAVHWGVSARGVAQFGSALALGARGRGFESRHPDQPETFTSARIAREYPHVKSTVENLSPTRVRLAVEVPFDELKPSLDAAYKAIAAAGAGPGLPSGQGAGPDHRPARRPRHGAAGGRQRGVPEALRRGRPRARAAARSASPRSTSPTSTDSDDRCSFTAEVDVRPEITLPDLDGIAGHRRRRRGHRRRHRRAARRAPRPVRHPQRRRAAGRRQATTSRSTCAPSSTAKRSRAVRPRGLSYVVGSDDLIDGLDDAIAGKSAGESATFTATLRQASTRATEAEVTATVARSR